MKVWVKPFDIIIIILAAGLTFFSAYTAYMNPQGRPQVLIRGQGGQWTFPLGAEETVIVAGPLGNTIVKIDTGRAWIESSPCANQNCTAKGQIMRQGLWAACLPNNVLLIIQGTEDNEFDAVAW